MTERQHPRWSDKELEAFHQEFLDHIAPENRAHAQQQDLYDAIFRLEDKDRGVPPGLMQITARIAASVEELQERDRRQRTFIGGVLFALGSLGFFLTDSAHKLIALLKSL